MAISSEECEFGAGETPLAPRPVLPKWVLIGDGVYNADHIVKVEVWSTPGKERVKAMVHTTLGVDVFYGTTARHIRRFFMGVEPTVEAGKESEQ